jgi:microcin C transport system substrate-binding protein
MISKMIRLNRRDFFTGVAAAIAVTGMPGGLRALEGESHGMSIFGELQYGPDFPHFDYVDPAAPKGGVFSSQISQLFGNQNFDTFNTLHVYVLQGDGAAGMNLTFDSLMAGSGDEPDALYGLVAQSVSRSEDGLTYRFRLRPEARFHDGSRVLASDVAFSINILKEQGHPVYVQLLRLMDRAEAEGEDVVVVTFLPERPRDLPLFVAGLPIFSEAYWEGRNFRASTLEAPLGSGPYRVGRFEVGRNITFERVEDYWGADLPVNVGQNNFGQVRFEYFRDRQVAFEAFKAGTFNYREEFTSREWARGYDFPARIEGRVLQEELPDETPSGRQGWWLNTRRDKFADPRIREAVGMVFDFEWTNRNIMFDAYARTVSYFENSPMKAEGPPPPDELALLEPYRGILPEEVFGEPFTPPVSDGSGQDRSLLRRASQLLTEAGCTRQGNILLLPSGQPFTIEFLDFQASLQPHTQPFQSNLRRLGIEATSRIVDAAQYQRRMDEFDFDTTSRRFSGSLTPGGGLRVAFSSEAADTNGSSNLAGIRSEAVDALLDIIAEAETRDELYVAARALDRVLRAGRYWVPMWFKPSHWIAHWDEFSRPDRKPRYAIGSLSTWWYDIEKARRIGRA